jgi:hypothetical protein
MRKLGALVALRHADTRSTNRTEASEGSRAVERNAIQPIGTAGAQPPSR